MDQLAPLCRSLQYLALQSSTPINVTLVASGMPVWMLLVGWLGFGVRIGARQMAGALLSVAGVLLVLSRGEWSALLAMRLVPGDVYMILATIAWSVYSWMLTRPKDPPALRADWAAFLLAQMIYGVLWSGLFAGIEAWRTPVSIAWSWPIAAALLYVAAGPALIAYRCWGAGVARTSPSMAAYFFNLTPLFAALLSSAFLGEVPHLYHAAAFVLIVGGIACSARVKA